MTESGPWAIEVRGLAKRFGRVQALAGVDFEVREGEVFGFLGPNGAGKTTTIDLLTGLARPDRGTIAVAGLDVTGRPQAAQHRLGVVPDESNLYDELTGFENLCFCASLYGIGRRMREARAAVLLDEFGLAEAAGRKFGGYSKGMKRRLTIAAGIIHEPPVLFLDEPTTGLDVASARHIRRLIAELNRRGTTIFLTTHYIEEAERLCHRIAFLVAGRVVRTDSVAALMGEAHGQHVVEFALGSGGAARAEELAAAFPEVTVRVVADNALRVDSPRPLPIAPLVRLLEERGVEVTEARKLRPSLEEVFVRITGIEAAAMTENGTASGGSA